MKQNLVDKLCCPFDKKSLELTIVTRDTEENIIEGYLLCETCNRIYPIVKGIPIMNPDEYREFQFEKPLYDKWKKQLKSREVKDFKLIE